MIAHLLHGKEFLCFWCVTRGKDKGNTFEKQGVNFCTQGIARSFREMIKNSNPQLIGAYQAFQYGEVRAGGGRL